MRQRFSTSQDGILLSRAAGRDQNDCLPIYTLMLSLLELFSLSCVFELGSGSESPDKENYTLVIFSSRKASI